LYHISSFLSTPPSFPRHHVVILVSEAHPLAVSSGLVHDLIFGTSRIYFPVILSGT
jgi:hypothetical protein